MKKVLLYLVPLFLLLPSFALAVSSGPTPNTGTNGLFDVYVDSNVDYDEVGIFSTTGSLLECDSPWVVPGGGAPHTYHVNLFAYGTQYNGNYPVTFKAGETNCATLTPNSNYYVLTGNPPPAGGGGGSTAGADDHLGGGIGVGTSTPGFGEYRCDIIDPTTTICTGTQIYDNPVFDIFSGFVLFFLSFSFIIWFFRKRI